MYVSTRQLILGTATLNIRVCALERQWNEGSVNPHQQVLFVSACYGPISSGDRTSRPRLVSSVA